MSQWESNITKKTIKVTSTKKGYSSFFDSIILLLTLVAAVFKKIFENENLFFLSVVQHLNPFFKHLSVNDELNVTLGVCTFLAFGGALTP